MQFSVSEEYCEKGLNPSVCKKPAPAFVSFFVDFILQILKYNDNSGNPYSDVYWLAAFVDSIGKIDFAQ